MPRRGAKRARPAAVTAASKGGAAAAAAAASDVSAAPDDRAAQRPKLQHDDGSSAVAAAGAMMTDGEAAGGSGGPLGRLDFDSLSIVLSMLSTTDFLHAVRSSKRLYAARLKKTAWPPLPAQADAMLRTIMPGASDSAASSFRGLRSTFDQRGQKLKHLLTLLPSAAADNSASASSASAMWRNVRQVSLDCKVEYHKQRDGTKFLQPLEQVLSGLARHLPQLSSLSLANLNPYFSPGFVQSFYTDLAARGGGQLLALSLNKCAWTFARADMLSILTPCLRVLSLDCTPAPAALVPLVHLEALHIAGSYGGRIDPDALATAIRFLSTKHALRTLSLVRSDVDRILFLLTTTRTAAGTSAQNEPSTEVVQAHFSSGLSSLNSSSGSRELRNPPQLDNASLGVGVEVDAAVPSRLTSLSAALPLPNAWQVESLCALPELTHLELTGCGAGPGRGFVCSGPKAVLDVFAKMHSLTLSLSDEYTFTKDHLRACNQLRSLRLTQQARDEKSSAVAVPLDIVVEILQRNAATLEELRLEGETCIEMPSQDAAAAATQRLQTVLASCTRLRVLEMAASAGLGAVVAALPRAPALQTVELTCHQVAKQGGLDALRSVELLRLMSSSSSWCSTHVHLAPREMLATLGSAAALEEAWPAAGCVAAASSIETTTLRRIRLFVHRTDTTDCFCLRRADDDDDGDAGLSAPPQWQLDFSERNV